MDILKITTAGSVDDGKSTLIGRLLYDTRSITNDKIEAIESTSKKKGLDFVDLSLLTDGLIAEREQGITIDVAHIYFSTPNRKFVIADSPGHLEYTRNMITGASNSNVSLILIDARKGVIEQTKRHFYIASLLRIKEVLVCVNKMDLVDFGEQEYDSIRNEFEKLSQKVGFEGQSIRFIPIAAKQGDNIVFPSNNMPWYNQETLLDILENIPVSNNEARLPARFPVQYVVRPHSDQFHDFRGYAGKLSSGSFRKGDNVIILPSLKKSKIRDISMYTNSINEIATDQSVVITLEDDVDISRGNMLIKECDSVVQKAEINATICWMDEQAAVAGKCYLFQHGPNRVKSKLTAVHNILDIQSLEPSTERNSFSLNDIGEITLKLAKPVFADEYNTNPGNGRFILIDEFTNNTVAVGFVR